MDRADRSIVGRIARRLVPSGDGVNVVVRGAARPLYRALTPMRVEGASKLPAHGPVILAANHISFYDTVVLMLSVPRRNGRGTRVPMGWM